MSVTTMPVRRTVPALARPRATGVLGRRLEIEESRPEESPWTFADLRTSGLLGTLGGVGVGVCWAGASSSKVYTDQLIWTGLALLALGIALGGGFVWILAGMRTVRAERLEVLTTLSRLPLMQTTPTETPDLATTTDLGELLGSVVVAPGMSRYHQRDCAFAINKKVRTMPSSEAQQTGLAPCEVCRP